MEDTEEGVCRPEKRYMEVVMMVMMPRGNVNIYMNDEKKVKYENIETKATGER